MIHGMPLLANAFEALAVFLKIAIPLIVVISWVIRAALSQQKNEAPQPRRAAGRPPRATERPPKGKSPADPKLNKEIEEFLKRTAQRRGAKVRSEGVPPPVAQKKPPRRLAESLPTLEPASPSPTGESVAEHVKQHLATDEFGVRAAHLADDVARAEQEMQQHVTQAFSHQVGRLADTSGDTTEQRQAAAVRGGELAAAAGAGIPALLADGARLRQAIIVNEILQRPEHRW